MNYLKYYILASLLVYTVGPADAGFGSEKVQRLFIVMQSGMAECPEKVVGFSFYKCPSHFWPEIMHNLVPALGSLGTWLREKMGVDVDTWYHMLGTAFREIVNLDANELTKIVDEVKAWTLLNHYLKFDEDKYVIATNCLNGALKSLTVMDLEKVSMLPFGGNWDHFDEINRIVNDPKKARLLDGIKRATRDKYEMDWMIKSLRRLSATYGMQPIRNFKAAFEEEVKRIPIEQLRAITGKVPDFKGREADLIKLLGLMHTYDFYEIIQENPSVFKDSLPLSFPYYDYLADFLTKLLDETKYNKRFWFVAGCAIKENLRVSTDWNKVVTYNACAMKVLSRLSNEFFDEYANLKSNERSELNDKLEKANLPTLLPYEF